MIEISNLKKTFEGEKEKVRAIQDLNLTVPEGKLFTLLGPSGCGKSTALRCVAGLERPEQGEIKIGEDIVFSSGKGLFVPPHKRGIGMVFQSYAIWPHMSVFDNVAYPLKIKKMRREDIRERVRRALTTVGLQELEDRLAPQLSGGQQQRVALARALVKEPRILLLDEPLCNLDAKLREEMRLEVKELQRRLGITALYVTHDQTEALAISDFIAVMNEGRIIDTGTPKQIYNQPKTRFTADFIGSTNIVRGKVLEKEGSKAKIATPFGEITCCLTQESQRGEEVFVLIRPETVRLSKEQQPPLENTFEGEVTSFVFLGETIDCHFMLGGEPLRARVDPSMALKEKEKVFVRIESDSVLAIPTVERSNFNKR